MVLNKEDKDTPEKVSFLLSEGKVCILPCDTMYGFVGIVPTAREGILYLKGRSQKNPLLELALSITDVQSLSSVPLPGSLLALWPGPLTLVIPVISGGTLGVRVPDDDFLMRILKTLSSRIYSTSVNQSGQDPLKDIDEIKRAYGDKVACIVDGGSYEKNIPSTVLDVTSRPYTILRQGAMSIPQQLLKG